IGKIRPEPFRRQKIKNTRGNEHMTIARRDLLALGSVGLAASMGVRVSLAADKTIILGCSIPLSGPAAPTGITTQRTVEHALEVINAKGIQIGPDRYTIVAEFYDNKYI